MAFGQAFLRTGKFGRKGRNKIRKAGFANTQDFLTGSELDQNTASLQSLSDALKGNKAAPVQPAQEEAAATPVQTQPTITENLVGQGVNLANRGSDILGNQNTSNQSGSSFAKAFANAQNSLNPNIAENANSLLNQQFANTREDIDNYFSGDPLDEFRSQIGQDAVDAQQSGLINSRSANQIRAGRESSLIDARARELLKARQNFNANQINQLDQQRAASSGLASLFSNQGVQQGNLANQEAQIGSQLANQGFQNQLAGLQLGSNLSQRDFDNAMRSFTLGNQISQQDLQNINAAKANKFSRKRAEQLFSLLTANQNGGGGITEGILGAAGGIGGAFLGGPAGAAAGAGIGKSLGGLF